MQTMTNGLENFYDINSLTTHSLTNNIQVHSIHIEYNIQVDHAQNEPLEFLLQSFVNQRKMYRQYIAATEYENDCITEVEFDDVEQSCAISISKKTNENLEDKILYLYDMIKAYYPEELEYMNNDDLADICGVSKYTLDRLIR